MAQMGRTRSTMDIGNGYCQETASREGLVVGRLLSAMLWLAALVPVLGLTWSMWYFADAASRGLDITDEAYYLMVAADPAAIAAAVRFDGFYIGLLFDAVGADIPAFRFAGVVVLGLVGTGACSMAFRLAGRLMGLAVDARTQVAVTATFALATLAYYSTTLLTPSYNWLNLIGLFLSVGAFCLSRFGARFILPGMLVAGTGLGISFLAKFPSAVACFSVIATAVFLWPGHAGIHRFFQIGALACGIAGVLAFHSFFFQGPVEAFTVFQRGRQAAAYLGAHDVNVLLLDFFTSLGMLVRQVWDEYRYGYVLVPAVFAAVAVATRGRREAVLPWLVVILAVACVAQAAASGKLHAGVGRDYAVLANALAMSTLLLLVAATVYQCDARSRSGHGNSLQLVLLALLLLSLPVAFAFGTGNSPAILHGRRAIAPLYLLCLIPLFYLLARHRALALISIPLAAISLGFVLRLATVGELPYRLAAALDRQIVPTEVGNRGSSILLDEPTARAWKDLREALQTAGLRPSSTMVDLTGRNPGMVFGVGARSLAVPWIPGGYQGSFDMARYVLGLADPAELAETWIVTSAAIPGAIDASALLGEFEIGFPDGYERVYSTIWPQRYLPLEVWRPNRVAPLFSPGAAD